MNIRKKIWNILEPAKQGDTMSRVFDIFILSLILLNILAVIVGSVKSVQDQWHWESLKRYRWLFLQQNRKATPENLKAFVKVNSFPCFAFLFRG